MSTLYIRNAGNKLTFEFNGISAPIHHFCESRQAYAREAFKELGFELYECTHRDSWTNDMMLIVTDSSRMPKNIVADLYDDLEIYAEKPVAVETKALAKRYDHMPAAVHVKQYDLDALQQRKKFFGI